MKMLNRTVTASTLALMFAAGAPLSAAAQQQTPPIEPQSPYHATQMQPASPQMWDPALVEAGMRSLGYDEISNVRQEGGQWLAEARQDGDQYELTFDPVTGDVRDNTDATVGKAPQIRTAQNQAGGTTPENATSSGDGSSAMSGMASGSSSADMSASQERVITALEAAGLTNVSILNTAYLVQAQTQQGEMVTMVVDTARLAAAAAGAAGTAGQSGSGGNAGSGASSTGDGGTSGQNQNGNAGGSGSDAGTNSEDAGSSNDTSSQ
jgi:hypothetical protein